MIEPMEFAASAAFIADDDDYDAKELEVDESELQQDLLSNLSPAPSAQKKKANAELKADGIIASKPSSGPMPSAPMRRMDIQADIVAKPPPSKLEAEQAPMPPPKPIQRKPIRRQADTNVVAIKFSTLAQKADDLFAGDPVFCSNDKCKAVLSATSKLVKNENKDGPSQVWTCEFCSKQNPVDVDPEEIPTTASRDYVVEGVKEKKDEKKAEGAGMTIFCLDISGSMGVTTAVPGSFKLKGADKHLAAFDIPELRGQQAPQQQKNETYVSRLQCVQASIDQMLESWAKDQPEKQAGLITFNNEVTILGDGTSDPVVITGDKLRDQAQLMAAGAKYPMEKNIKETAKALAQKLFAIEETGPTSLGPALAVAVAMAAKKNGSTVVICTDGLANVGLGALDGVQLDDQRQEIEKWYEGVANYAKLYGVRVNVISIKGAECALDCLGRVAEITGGDVTRVDPLQLTQNFASILANNVIATQVSATFLLHEGLKFRNEKEDTNKLRREIGNASEDTEVTFEYQMKADHAKKFKELKALPFQVQINFTKLDGMKCLRVISRSQPITNKREVAEQNVRLDLLAANVAQQGARMAEAGNYDEARANNLAWGRMMGRAAKSDDQKQVFDNWLDQTAQFDHSIQAQSAQLQQAVQAPQSKAGKGPAGFLSSIFGGGGNSNSPSAAPASSSSAFGAPGSAGPSSSPVPSMERAARRLRNDAQYEEIHQFKGKSSKAFSATPVPKKSS